MTHMKKQKKQIKMPVFTYNFSVVPKKSEEVTLLASTLMLDMFDGRACGARAAVGAFGTKSEVQRPRRP